MSSESPEVGERASYMVHRLRRVCLRCPWRATSSAQILESEVIDPTAECRCVVEFHSSTSDLDGNGSAWSAKDEALMCESR